MVVEQDEIGTLRLRLRETVVPVTNFIRASEAGAPDPSGVNV